MTSVAQHHRPESKLRSFLFSPGADARKLAKAASSDADAVIFDLEDAVADSRKADARQLVADETTNHGAARPVFVRVNAVPTGLLTDDLTSVCVPGLAGIWLPKAENVEDVRFVDNALTQLEAERDMQPGSVHLHLSLETARGVYLAYELASACDRVTALSAGTAEAGDLHAEMAADGRTTSAQCLMCAPASPSRRAPPGSTASSMGPARASTTKR